MIEDRGKEKLVKLMVFSTFFCTADLTRNPNFDTAIIFKTFCGFSCDELWGTCRHAPHTLASRAFEKLYLSRKVLRWTILAFQISLTDFPWTFLSLFLFFFLEWAPLNTFHPAGLSSQAITCPPSELHSRDIVVIIYSPPQYIGKTILTRH